MAISTITAIDEDQQAIIVALATYLNDETKCPLVAVFNPAVETDPYSVDVGTPWITFLWLGKNISSSIFVSAELVVMVGVSPTDQKGPQAVLTNLDTVLVRTLRDINLAKLGAVKASGKSVNVQLLSPVRVAYNAIEREEGQLVGASIYCDIKYVL